MPRYNYAQIEELRQRFTWEEIADRVDAPSANSMRSSYYKWRKRKVSAAEGAASANAQGSATGALPADAPTPESALDSDVQKIREKRIHISTERKYDAAVHRIAELESQVEALTVAHNEPIEPVVIEPKHGAGVSEATLVVLASDWHIEERVDPATVNGKNKYNLEIAKRRVVGEYFPSVVRLAEILTRDVLVENMVFALLGDFISGDIHDELLEVAELPPIDAMLLARDWIANGIEFFLEHTPFNLTIPCHSGNHARTKKERRVATEAGHSLEFAMYNSLARHFEGNPRVRFIIPRSYHSYVQVYDKTLRFHHGHAIRYQGGVGGPTIPINKAIASWNTVQWADIDCFGHLHQRLDGENFVMNGSIIGYSPYAISIKAKYQKPSQTMFLMDKKRGKTAVWPVVFTV